MQNLPQTVHGKVFVHPVTKVEFGTLRLPHGAEKFATLDRKSFDSLADDGCGNCFTIVENGSVLFWDHETEINLDRSKVKSVWIEQATRAEIVGAFG